MSGIFISYRRVDTLAWAGRLLADLRNSFGAAHVFMDINGGIPRAADFEQVLTAALGHCDVLLALIGPQWTTCTRSDGRRRLEVPADWVRNEIATALRRRIPVVPVVFGGSRLPPHTELPEDLRRMLSYQLAEINDMRWEYDVGELIKDLCRLPLLKQLHDVALTNPQTIGTEGTHPILFLCYRREDTSDAAGRLHDRLMGVYGSDGVFMDIDSVPLGIDFVDHVAEQISKCKAVIVMIGKQWLKVKDKRRRRRLDNEDDLVRAEIAAALQQKVPVIPILVQDAAMPSGDELPENIRLLARRNGISLSTSRWHTDVERLIKELDPVMKR